MYKSALLIWLRTTLFNAIFISLGAIQVTGRLMIIVFPVVLVVGAVITCPLIFIIVWLIKKYVALPYHPVDKLYWLMFVITILGLVFLLLLLLAIQYSLTTLDAYIKFIIASVILSTSLAVRFTKSSLTCLNIIYHEKYLV